MDPYEVLGVSPQAKAAEVTAAYRVLAQIFHPDRYLESPLPVQQAAASRMSRLNDAYQAIKRGVPASARNGTAPGRRPGNWAGAATGSWASAAARRNAPDARTTQREGREKAARAAREHDAQARVSKDRRVQDRQSAQKGQARAGAKARARSVSGMGQALHSNEIVCRGCKAIQKLPTGWQDHLDDTSWYCSFCDRLLLSR